MSKNPCFLADTATISESQQVKAYELRVCENVSLKIGFLPAIMEISAIEESSFDCEMHERFGGNKVFDMILQNECEHLKFKRDDFFPKP